MLDPRLGTFVGAANDEEAERQLESLLEQQVRPLVTKIVGRKLSAYGPRWRFASEDIEDVVGDAILLLLRRLQTLRAQPEAGPIESLDDYAATVAFSVCAHHLRRKHPEWSRLKNRVRYVLGREKRFSLWEVADRGYCCGLAQWHAEAPTPAAVEKLVEVEQSREQWPQSWRRPSSVDRADPAPLIGEIFERVGGAVELDRLVGLVAAIWEIDRAPQRSAEKSLEMLPDSRSDPADLIDQRRFAERVWTEIQQLPVRQRVALLLNLRDSRGAGMLWIFPVTGVASMRALAGALELPTEELAAMWQRLPIDDAGIAERLGCTRQQVINLRMSARKRLGNRLGTYDAPEAANGRPAANPAGVSTSLGMRRE